VALTSRLDSPAEGIEKSTLLLQVPSALITNVPDLMVGAAPSWLIEQGTALPSMVANV